MYKRQGHVGTVIIIRPRVSCYFLLYKIIRGLWRLILADPFRTYERVNESFCASTHNLSLRGFCNGTIMVHFIITLNMVYKTITIVFFSLVIIKQTLNNLYEYIVSGLYNICQDLDRFIAKKP